MRHEQHQHAYSRPADLPEDLGVSLVATFIVIGVGLAANSTLNMSTQLEARAPVLKAGKPILWSINEQSLIR